MKKAMDTILNKAMGRARPLTGIHLVMLLVAVMLGSMASAQSDYIINVTTAVTPPVNQSFTQMAGNGQLRVTFTGNGFAPATTSVYARASIECLAPTSFAVKVSDNYFPQQQIQVQRNVPLQLNAAQLRDAFGNSQRSNLEAIGININALVDPNNNLVLPPGTYRVCFTAVDPNLRPSSLPNTGCATFVVPPANPTNGVIINTLFTPPSNPAIFQAVSRGAVRPTVLFNNPSGAQAQVKIFGRIESLSPKQFAIELRQDYNQQQPITLTPSIPVQLNPSQVSEAFGNFNEGDLVTTGISFNELRNQNNVIMLPEGLYRICFYARYFENGALTGPASNVNLGCANFNICYKAGAPQFTRPVSNFNINSIIPQVRMASPVIFSWTPPIATCGLSLSALTYDFEIREMFEGQTITDAINNPPVFFKNGLRSPTYLLDTILYKQVLQRGKMYVIRVRANAGIDAPIIIDNGGYSRVQGFIYGEAPLITATNGPVLSTRPTGVVSTITTSVLKGHAVWSFKKAEEEMPSPGNNAVLQPGTVSGIYTPPVSGRVVVENSKNNIDPNLRLTAGSNIVLSGGVVLNTGVNAGNHVNASQPATPPTNSAGPQQMLLTTVIGDGETVEVKDLKIAPDKGKVTHPLVGAVVMIKGVKAGGTGGNAAGNGVNAAGTGGNAAGTGTGASASFVRISTDNPIAPPSVSLGTQLGVVHNTNTIGSSISTASINTTAGIPNFSVNYVMPDESTLDEDLLASGTTDASGNFVLNYIDPKFRNIVKYTKLHVTVEADDFERYSQFLPVASPSSNGDIDLGDVQLVAKTFRFTPSIQGLAQGATIDLYTPAKTYSSKPHYAFMIAKSSGAEKKTIAGKEYVKVASLRNDETINKLFYQHGYYDNMIVQVNASGKEQYSSYLGLTPVAYAKNGPDDHSFGAGLDESKLVISVKKRYTLKNQLPYIMGKVEVFVDDKNNSANSATFPDKGAVVTVSFDKTKVVEEYKDVVNGPGGTAPAGTNSTISNVVTGGINRPVTTTAPVNANVAVNGNANLHATNANATIATNGNFRLVSQVNPAIGAQIKTLFQYSTTTDEEGNYRVDKLPVLQEGNYFTVTVKTSDGMDSVRRTDKFLARGDFQEINFQFRPDVFTVTGIAVDEAGVPLTDALLIWKSGGVPIEASHSGLFVTSNYKDDSLTIKNQGYLDKTIFVKINKTQPTNAGKVKIPGSVSGPIAKDLAKEVTAWATTLASQPSVKSASAGGAGTGSGNGSASRISAATFGYAVNTSSISPNSMLAEFSPVYNSLVKPDQNTAGFKDIGKVGYLVKGYAKINFIVKDATAGTRVPNAIVIIDEVFDTTTNATGEVLYKGGGSGFTYSVKGAAGTDFIAQTGEISSLPVDGSVTTVNVSLDHGVKLSGKVTAKGANLPDAEIFVDGKEYITTKSKTDGTYELYVPKGENTVKATKPGYVGKQVNKTFTTASIENFSLEDGGGHNISKLMGFAIELESHTPDGSGEKWTGSFVNLQANTVFSVTGNKKLKFTNVRVTFDVAGNPLVASNEVKTDVTEMSAKLFGYVPITIKGSPQITVRQETPGGKGTIGGKLQLNLDMLSTAGGLLFSTDIKPLIALANTSIDKDVPVFTSDGSMPSGMSFVFSNARELLKSAADKAVAEFQPKVDKATGDGKAALVSKLTELKTAAASAVSYTTGSTPIPATLDQYTSIEVYGFQAMINLSKCKVDATGLDMAGFVLSPELPILSTMFFDIERLKIGTDFSVKDISVKSNLHLKFSIASWSAEINSVAFNMRGFKVGGKIEVQIPQSPKNTLEFADLAFGSSGLYGGSFSFPGDGLSIFNIINLKTGGTPLSFGEIGNTGVYKLGGSAKFSFGSMFSESIDVPYFQVQTNGKFGVTVPVNRSLNAGFAKFALNSITFNTTTPSPQIDLDGQFSVDVKLLKFSSGGIHFRTSGVSVDKIGLGLDIPGTKVDGFVDIKPNGFAGGGSLSVVGTPLKVSIDFHYFKVNGGVDLGANFVAGVKIPIGPVIITKVGGGFTYRSNPEFFSVTITGGASITGFETLISLDPISITVESGPKLVGEAHLKVASLDVAKATLVIDIPNEYFAVGVVADFQPLPDIITAHIQGDLIVSTKREDTYFFLGAGMHVSLLGLINAEGVFALGVGVKNAKTRETISYYMAKAPSEYLSNGTFTGIYINSLSEMGVTKENAPELDLYIVSGKIWLHSRSDFSLIANFQNANFHIQAGMSFEGGIEACVVGICASASAKACVNIGGGYSNDLGWNFNASASGEATLGIGSDCGCNDICIGLFYAGGKICVGAGAKIRYESKKGGLNELSMFIGSRSSCP